MKPVFPLVDFLGEMAARPGATDLTLCSDGRVALRQNARLAVSDLPPLRELWVATLEDLFPPQERGGRCVRVIVDAKGRRYRTILSRDHSGESLSVRFLPSGIKSPSELLMPDGLESYFLDLRSGLFLVGGPTGSGKSTTVASLLQSRARKRGGKIVTIEDPVEFLHEGAPESIVVQRELGRSVPTYAEGLKDALLMNPDVISVQEIREQASAETALSAALSGHLVVASLHAYSASSAPQRFLSLMNPAMDDLGARDALASCLEGVVIQRLLPGYEGLVPVFEVMLFRERGERLLSMERLVRQGNWAGLRQEIETGQRRGMLLARESCRQRAEMGLLPEQEVCQT